MVAKKHDFLAPRMLPEPVPFGAPHRGGGSSSGGANRGAVRRPTEPIQVGDVHPRTGRMVVALDENGDARWGVAPSERGR